MSEKPLSERMRAGVEEIPYSPFEGIDRPTLSGWADEASALEAQVAAMREAAHELCYAPKNARPKRPMQALRAALAPLTKEVPHE